MTCRRVSTPCVQDIPVFNLLSVLDGKIINDAGYSVDRLSGEVTIAVPQSNPNLLFPGPESIVIVGEQPDVARRAIEQNVNCLIVCQAGLPEELREMPTKTCIIATPFDAFPRRADGLSRDRNFAHLPHGRSRGLPSERFCRRREGGRAEEPPPELSDFDENDKVVGTLSRFHLIKPRRKRVVLVDHNEAAQSVPGLEQADILAIIDHHRLADIQTGAPIYFRNEPVGSTATIIAEMYQERGPHALAEPRGPDGGGHRGRYGHVQISDVHAARPPHGRAHGAHREHLARRAGP